MLTTTIPDATCFYYLCLQEGRGRIVGNAYNKWEQAIGPAQIRPCFLQDANEWRMKQGLDPFNHRDMYNYENAFQTCLAYWERYGLETLEQRARAHAGGPDGPIEDCTLDYYNSLLQYVRRVDQN